MPQPPRRQRPGGILGELVLRLVIIAVIAGCVTVVNLVLLKEGYFDAQVQQRFQVMALVSLEEWNNSWFGVAIQQYPNDLQIYQELIYRIKPDIIIETGTFHGGLTLYLSHLLGAIHPQGKVITVDLYHEAWNETKKKLDVPSKDELLRRIVAIQGSSTDPTVLRQVQSLIPAGSKVLVILDSLHTKEHVLEELKQYSSLVTVDSYLIVNDTQHDGLKLQKEPGAMAALQEFLAQDTRFVVDPQACKFVVSCALSGYLKRVK